MVNPTKRLAVNRERTPHVGPHELETPSCNGGPEGCEPLAF